MAGLPHRSAGGLASILSFGMPSEAFSPTGLVCPPRSRPSLGGEDTAATTPSCAPMHGRTMMPAPKTLGRTLQFGYSGCALCGWPAHCRRQTAGRCVQAVRPELDHRLRHYRGHPRPCNRTGGDGFRGRDHLRHRHFHLLLPHRLGGARHQGLPGGHSWPPLPCLDTVRNDIAAGVSGSYHRHILRPGIEPRLYPSLGTGRRVVAVQPWRGRQGPN